MPSDETTAARYALDSLSRLYGGAPAPAAAVEELCRVAPAVRFARGEVVFSEGEPADRALFVVEGRLRASIRAGEDQRTVGECLSGEVAGEAAIFLTGGRRVATVTAVEATSCLVLVRDVFRLSAANPALIAIEQHLMRVLARRIADTEALIDRAWRETGGARPALRDRLRSLLGAEP